MSLTTKNMEQQQTENHRHLYYNITE